MEERLTVKQAEIISGGGEKCQRCHKPYPYVWHAPDDLWRLLTGITDGSGLFCIDCFDAMADNKHIILYWSCARDAFPGIPYLRGKVVNSGSVAGEGGEIAVEVSGANPLGVGAEWDGDSCSCGKCAEYDQRNTSEREDDGEGLCAIDSKD